MLQAPLADGGSSAATISQAPEVSHSGGVLSWAVVESRVWKEGSSRETESVGLVVSKATTRTSWESRVQNAPMSAGRLEVLAPGGIGVSKVAELPSGAMAVIFNPGATITGATLHGSTGVVTGAGSVTGTVLGGSAVVAFIDGVVSGG